MYRELDMKALNFAVGWFRTVLLTLIWELFGLDSVKLIGFPSVAQVQIWGIIQTGLNCFVTWPHKITIQNSQAHCLVLYSHVFIK